MNKLLKKIKSFLISRKNIAIMLTFCMAILAITSSISLAKFVEKKQDNDASSVSLFINGVDITTESIDIKDMSPGSSQRIDFSITNYKNDLVCEVALNYDIIITTENNLPLNIVVETSSSSVKGEYATPSSDTMTWKDGNMKAGVKDIHNYSINIEWPADKNDYNYSTEVDMIKIILRTEQVL